LKNRSSLFYEELALLIINEQNILFNRLRIRNAVKTQAWISISISILVAIAKKKFRIKTIAQRNFKKQ